MDVQLKRGLLDICVLASVKYRDSYGYRMIKDIRPYITISESTLYPILKRLEAVDMITEYSKEHNGRLRKYYHITDCGRQRLEDFCKEWDQLTAVYQYIMRGDDSYDEG